MKDFAQPPHEFHPVPWWAWTGKMEKVEMRRQLVEMRDKGIYELFIFALYGLEHPVFLKESWWDMVDYTLVTARKLGMKIWIYDDLNWPSGSAGGWVLRDHPECRAWNMNFHIAKVAAGADFAHDVVAQKVFAEFRGADGLRRPLLKELAAFTGEWKNTTGEDGEVLLIERVPFEAVMLNSTGTAWNWDQKGAVDLLSRAAVGQWMDYIHEEYWRRFRSHFGATLKGFFFDEPYSHPKTSTSLPWTPRLFGDFKKRYGYDLVSRLPHLFFEDPGYLRTRRDYWRLVSDLFSRNFSKQIADWCGRRKVLSTGHFVYEELRYQQEQLACNGDIHDSLKWMQVPGIDLLGKPTSFRFDDCRWYDFKGLGMAGLILTAKRASSTARYSGAKRVMCEACGVRNWNCSMAEQKVVGDWLAAMGVSLINDNSLIYTITDFRKRAISGKHFTQPWWQHYRLYNEYCARVSLFAATGHIETEVAVVYPTTAHFAMTPMDQRKEVPPEDKLVGVMDAVSDSLLREHIDFEILFEEILAKGEVREGRLVVPHAAFRVIILPQMRAMDEKVRDKLAALVRGGGRVIVAGDGPRWVLPSESQRGEARPCEAQHGFEHLGFTSAREKSVFSRKIVDLVVGPEGRSYELAGQHHRDVVTCLRRVGQERLLLLGNQTPGNKELVLRHSFGGVSEILDVDGGGTYTPEVRHENGSSALRITLGEEQSCIVRLAPEKSANARPISALATWAKKSRHCKVLANTWDFSVTPMNHFLPPLWIRQDPLDRGRKDRWFRELPPTGEGAAWMPVVEEKYAMSFSPAESAHYWLLGAYNLAAPVKDLCLIADDELFEELYVNGKRVGPSRPCTLWDQNNRSFAIARLSRPGVNHFCLRVRTSPWFAPARRVVFEHRYTGPVVLGGTFGVARGKKKLIESPAQIGLGSWTEQGYPDFAGTGSYRQRVDLSRAASLTRLVVENAFAVVEAEVNGHACGVRAWKPYIFDVAAALRAGANEITLKVSNSLGNLLRRYYSGKIGARAASGLLGQVWLE